MKAVFADRWLSVAALGWLAIVATPMARLLESSMAGHVLLQIPLLVTMGYVVATRMEDRLQSLQRRWNAGGIPGVLLASFYSPIRSGLDAACWSSVSRSA